MSKLYLNGITLGGGDSSVSIPIGTITAWSTNTAPEGWLICNGGAISRTTYINLFNVIGTTFGTGDGKSTFNLPSYSGLKIPITNTVSIGGDGYNLKLWDGNVEKCAWLAGDNRLASGNHSIRVTPGSKIQGSSGGTHDVVLGIKQGDYNSGLIGNILTISMKSYIIKY